MTAKIPDFVLPCPILPTRKEWVELGDHTLRYGMEHKAVRTGERFHGSMHLRMKTGLPPKNLADSGDVNAYDLYDERHPDQFAKTFDGFLHPYLIELARGRYVLQGGNDDSRVVLDLKHVHNEPPVRCFVLKYEDTRDEDRSFTRRHIPIFLMEQAMGLKGTFEHDPRETWMMQAINEGEICEELFIGAKPEIVDINIEQRVALVSRPALLIVLVGNFHERFALVEKTWHDTAVAPIMEAHADIHEFRSYPRRDDAPSVDVTGLAPKAVVDKLRGKLNGLLHRKMGLGELLQVTTSASAKPISEAPEAAPGSAPPAEPSFPPAAPAEGSASAVSA